ncbi:hypothetical protein BJ322DRAFT_1044751 [Thelephora terrestris]|uniref:Transmembrane protein n=1 Tax=Thelephora terrestris TaxID=56493 RepID=A0A9P6HM97_9AGAM|nr:hypothetical protein BJ322DRAFT_1044751 [Thelephora terrestris]
MSTLSSASTRRQTGVFNPTTPRNSKISYNISTPPSATPSISSSTPFDWDAARLRKPPPYATPFVDRRLQALKNGGALTPNKSTPKRTVRKKTMWQKVVNLPSEIMFQVEMLPETLSFPSSKTSARLVGGSLNLVHLCVCISRIRKVPESVTGWEEMYMEAEELSFFDWTFPAQILLIGIAVFNSIYLFSRTRNYDLSLQPSNLVNSPNAKFVATVSDPPPPPSLPVRLWRAFVIFWRFLLNIPATTAKNTPKMARVQQLEIWYPGDFEKELFLIYSPANFLMWTVTNGSNWIWMLMLMPLVWVQMSTLTNAFQMLIKDKDIIAAEVMHEYDEKFVFPRVNPIRKDAAVMTHQAEVINVWED